MGTKSTFCYQQEDYVGQGIISVSTVKSALAFAAVVRLRVQQPCGGGGSS